MNLPYRLARKTQRKTGYPSASLAYYGPDASRASKAVVGIFPTAETREPADMKKWYSDSCDLRTDLQTMEEIAAFLDQHQVQRVSMVDRIIGCPHEEEIDYPKGENCPQCPYWADRDRWTGELLR